MNLRPHTFILPTFASLALPCHADSPPEPPSTYIAYSNSRRFFAQTNHRARTTTAYEKPASPGAKPRRLWQMKGWFRALYLANDGAHIVTGYDGFNLLRLADARPQTVLLRFFKRGKLLRNVTLGEMKLGPGNLRRTISHYAWRNFEGFDKAGRFIVETIDRRRLIFDVRTGRLLRTLRLPPVRSEPLPPE